MTEAFRTLENARIAEESCNRRQRRQSPDQAMWILAIALTATALGCGQNDGPSRRAQAAGTPGQAGKYVAPPKGTLSLIGEVRVFRVARGGLMVEAKTLLPQNTKVRVEMFPAPSSVATKPMAPPALMPPEPEALARSDGMTAGPGEQLLMETVGADGMLRSGPYDAPVPGRYRVELGCRFDRAWQSEDVLALVGEGGSRLPRAALVPNDPARPKAGGRMQWSTNVDVAGFSGEQAAIQAVVRGRLFVKGGGQSAQSVWENLISLERSRTLAPGTWSARENSDGTWSVRFPHRIGKKEKVANWQYNPRTGGVECLDSEAEMLSWMPAK